jgi:alkanesulfonate monooxygenase SsuD/methylene tetrahydromethanopterin reductase-like flavin-dependent oxidoreductase (luciferase family)
MKFGIFDYIDDRGEPLHKTYDDRLALLQAAEAAGFYGYHLTEHQGQGLDLLPIRRDLLGAP